MLSNANLLMTNIISCRGAKNCSPIMQHQFVTVRAGHHVDKCRAKYVVLTAHHVVRKRYIETLSDPRNVCFIAADFWQHGETIRHPYGQERSFSPLEQKECWRPSILLEWKEGPLTFLLKPPSSGVRVVTRAAQASQ